jgi:mRNA-degrading endonuclease RelE of RelBE toxin-antitoxin system
MICEVITTPDFRKAAKSLSKKYPSLSKDLDLLEDKLMLNPEMGTSLGGNVYKIRVSIKSKGKGKSGGARVITYVELDLELEIEEEITNVFLLTIYDKSETDSITAKEIKNLIKNRLG